MKKILFTLTLTLISITSFGMSYEKARENALFLTDKMAYELDLTEEQYEAAYEVNLDYLMGINTPDDVYAEYWRRRNIDISYILFDWQYTRFCAIDYFYRPLYWLDGFWRFRIYSHYPHRTYFYFGRPACYHSYRGAHAWHIHGSSWYHGHTFHHHEYGMRGGWDRGGYRNINNGWRANDGGHRGIGYRNQGNHHYSSGSHNNSDSRNDRYNGNDSHNNRYNGNGSHNNRYNNNDSHNNRYNSSGNRGEGVRRSSTRETVGDRRHDSGNSSNSSNSYTPSRDFGSKTISSGDRGSNNYSSSSSNRPSRHFGSRGSSSSSSSRGSSFSSSSSRGSSFSSSSSRGSHGGGSVSSRGGNSGGGGGGGHFGGGRR